MRMSDKCRNINSDNPLTSRRTDRGKNKLPVFCDDEFTHWNEYMEPPSVVSGVVCINAPGRQQRKYCGANLRR